MIEAVGSDDRTEDCRTEARFHGLVYKRCGNHLMPAVWQQMTQKIQLGFAICQIAHSPQMNFEENHEQFIEAALGTNLPAMLAELRVHLHRGLATIQFAAEAQSENLSTAWVQLAASLDDPRMVHISPDMKRVRVEVNGVGITLAR